MSKAKLLILSQQAERYHELIDRAQLPLVIQACSNVEEAKAHLTSTLLLAEPNLAAGLINSLERLEWLQSTWAGVSPLMAQALRKDYLLTGIKGIFGPLVSEYVFAYILFFERRLLEHQASQAQQRWNPLVPGRLAGKTLGILGTGSLASHLAKTAKHFAMQVLGFNSSGKRVPFFDSISTHKDFYPFLSTCDYLVNTLPETPLTYNLLDTPAFKALANHCVFINVGRGSIVKEASLLEALQQGKLKAAVLDVFETEPLSQDHPFWQHGKIFISSHTAAPSFPEDIAKIFVKNYQHFVKAEPLDYLIDFVRGY